MKGGRDVASEMSCCLDLMFQADFLSDGSVGALNPSLLPSGLKPRVSSIPPCVRDAVTSQAENIKTGMQSKPPRMLCGSRNISLILSSSFLGQRRCHQSHALHFLSFDANWVCSKSE